MTVVILGCGYTGRAVSNRLRNCGVETIRTTRHGTGDTLAFDALAGTDLSFIPRASRVLYSIPTLSPDPVSSLVRLLRGRVERVVYLSTTGVYGAMPFVDHTTPSAAGNAESRARIANEQAWQSGPWSSIVLRPAAIYGPGRGVHVSMAEGRFRLSGDGSNFVSRIHVEDLASHAVAALFSEVEGSWPVADEYPCTSREIAEYCSLLLGVPMPEQTDPGSLHHTRRANRRVDGSAVRKALGLTLQFPSYREGIPASLAEQER